MLIVFLIICLIFGIFVIVKSGDLLIESSLNISKCTGLSEQFIGATLLSFATTAPEMFVSVIASTKGSADICINNGFGSIICNVGLVLAISLIALNQKVKKQEFNFKAYFLLLSFALLLVFGLDFKISKLEAIMLIVVFIIYFITSLKSVKNTQTQKDITTVNKKQIAYSIIMFVIGAIGVALSANLLVNTCQKLAIKLNISEGIIAITVLALGTALPELVATLTAIKKKTLNLALGNIMGANIMNSSVLIGLSSLLNAKNLCINIKTEFITIPFCILFNLILTIPVFRRQKTFKTQGIIMLLTFFVYYFLFLIF